MSLNDKKPNEPTIAEQIIEGLANAGYLCISFSLGEHIQAAKIIEQVLAEKEPDTCEKCGLEVGQKMIGDELYRNCPDCGIGIEQ